MEYSRSVDTAPSKPDDLILPAAAGQNTAPAVAPVLHFPGASPVLLEELGKRAEAEACGLTPDEFGQVLAGVGAKVNHGLPPGTVADLSQKAKFFRGLHLEELALAHGCALGREAAWERFFRLYRSSLTQAAIAITGSPTLGNDLADALYAELYGLREQEGRRRSPLASYSGRGSLMGWLRTTLVQRYRDHYRRKRREEPLEDLDREDLERDAVQEEEPTAAEAAALAEAVKRTLGGLEAEDRFLLVAYYLDRQTLLTIARTVGVHEATISRRLKRLLSETRGLLLKNLCACGLSRAAAEEALGADPRDIEINLRALLQSSESAAFSNQRPGRGSDETAPARTAEPD
jgi:RNA polymerase sigma-70 factor (ECF subfamily)